MKHTEKYIINKWPELEPFAARLAGKDYSEESFYEVARALKFRQNKVYIWVANGRKKMKYISDLDKLVEDCGGKVLGKEFDLTEKKFKCDEHYIVEWFYDNYKNDA